MRRPPHLPFLDGVPSFAPGLSLIDETDWLAPDSEASDWLEGKRKLLKNRRADVVAFTDFPGAPEACDEAADMVLSALPEPYDLGDWPTRLEAAAANVSDDLCVMLEVEGEWRLAAASLCAPSYWRLTDYIGRSINGLHGAVPGGDPGLASRISRIFSAMRVEQIFERCNWTVQAGNERFLPSFNRMKEAASDIIPANALQELHLRVERQTIRKLTKSGAVLFTIRVCLDPLQAVSVIPGAMDALQVAWVTADPGLASYKRWPTYERLIESVLS